MPALLDEVQCIDLSLLSIIYCLCFCQKGSLCTFLRSKTIKYYDEVHQGKFQGGGFLSVYKHGQSPAGELVFGAGCKQFTWEGNRKTLGCLGKY